MSLIYSTRRRRIIMPAIIVLAALVIMYWSLQQKARAIEQIRQHVLQLSEDAAAGQNIADRLINSNQLVASQTADEIRDAWKTSSIVHREIIVTAGDVPEFNIGTATHTAMLRVSGKNVLGLRIYQKDAGDPIQILGYWLP